MPDTPAPAPSPHASLLSGLLADIKALESKVVHLVESPAVETTATTLLPALEASLADVLPAVLPAGTASLAALLTPAQLAQLQAAAAVLLTALFRAFLGRIPHPDPAAKPAA